MSDVFLSYAREDASQAAALARGLEGRGWSVFWDRRIPVGHSFRDLLEQEISAAGCVVVLWSKASVESPWVVEEAESARERGSLIPVLLEAVRVPLGFRALHSLDLAGWTGDPTDPLLVPLFESIGAQVKPTPGRVETHDTYIRSGNVFVSYSKEDEHYVKQLLSLLRNSGLPVWADDRIDFGDRWWRTIVANIRASVAMVIVMTPASENSKWVEREILLADKLDKPLFPVLLQGECHPLLITVQYHDVRDQSMPPQTFIDTLRRLANSGSSVPQMITTRATVARRGPEQERSLVARFFGWLSGRAE